MRTVNRENPPKPCGVFETEIKKMVQDKLGDPDAVLANHSMRACRVFVCATAQKSAGDVCFRNFESSRFSPVGNVKI
ncbi:hypothetical protein GGTG_12281 [Gaeumannomyces tritici R3-111a-1]|uniref:Uncharacterized protein n=1 Tax=Gaeumannomyces tritici (strain R3-111a-1) TaxID=644352 RepID=J3PFK6_GAET3|nr:hypothetical protein GGTG_12281 [Gaeumannomyces tritici R3-111a-1]EJT70108.1 hypothetical protein GGTG_12281 [Gaeumannomyces tritici R3-111a-1]